MANPLLRILYMKEHEDIAVLLTDPEFREWLIAWNDLNPRDKEKVLDKYTLSAREMNTLLSLWAGLDFRQQKLQDSEIDLALNETLWKLASKKSEKAVSNFRLTFYRNFSKVAAILLLPLLVYVGYLHFSKPEELNRQTVQRMITVNSKPGTITKLQLPDGSNVYLNAGSSISYPPYFHGDIRDVRLQGEAYFEVEKNEQMPMVIGTNELNLKVYGTTFNLNAFPSDDFVKVTLLEGSVALSSELGKFNGEDEFFVEPGQTVTFEETTKGLEVSEEDPYVYTAWKDGVLVFRNTEFEMVLKRLERNFNVDIELKDQSLASIPMDATFKNESIEEILRLLSAGTPFKYHIQPAQKLTDGTFGKTKIFIERN